MLLNFFINYLLIYNNLTSLSILYTPWSLQYLGVLGTVMAHASQGFHGTSVIYERKNVTFCKKEFYANWSKFPLDQPY